MSVLNENKKKYKKVLISMKDDFREVVKHVLVRLFEVNVDQNIKRIYIDINSALSILFRYESIDDGKLLAKISGIIEKFMVTHLDRGLDIIFLYTLETSLVHKTIYPEWCSARNKRVELRNSEFIKKLLVNFSAYSAKNNHIRVINCKGVHPALIINKLEKFTTTGCLVLSRDNVHRCISRPTVSLFNGVDWIQFNVQNRPMPDKIEQLRNPDKFLPYYLAMKGDTRNEYKGLAGMGKVRTVDYINSNRIKIVSDIEHKHSEFFKEFLPLYDMVAMENKLNELGVTVDSILGK